MASRLPRGPNNEFEAAALLDGGRSRNAAQHCIVL